VLLRDHLKVANCNDLNTQCHFIFQAFYSFYYFLTSIRFHLERLLNFLYIIYSLFLLKDGIFYTVVFLIY
jgi:hypothetical protein